MALNLEGIDFTSPQETPGLDLSGIDIPKLDLGGIDFGQPTPDYSSDFVEYLKNQEEKRLAPYTDVSGYNTIGYGHKIKEGESFNTLTDQEANDLLIKDINAHVDRAKRNVDAKFGEGTWEGLSTKQREMITDYEFNGGGVKEFPKFTKAVIDGNWEEARKEGIRHTKVDGKDVPLGKRNQDFYARYLSDEPTAMGTLEDVGMQQAPQEEPSTVMDIMKQIPAGIAKAGLEVIRTVNDIGSWMDSFVPESVKQWRSDVEQKAGINLDRKDVDKALQGVIAKLPEAETVGGEIAGTLSQFLAPMGVVSKGLKAVGYANTIMRGMASGAITDFSAFDPHRENVFNWLAEQDNPVLSNAVTKYLASDKEDSHLEGRINNMIEGLSLGVVGDKVLDGIKMLKGATIAGTKAVTLRNAIPKMQEATKEYMDVYKLNQQEAMRRAQIVTKLSDADLTRLSGKETWDFSQEAMKDIVPSDKVRSAVQKLEESKVAGDNKKISYYMRPIQSLVDKISPTVGHKLRQYEMKVHTRTQAAMDQIVPFSKQFAKMSNNDQAIFNDLWLNQNRDGMNEFLAKRPELKATFKQVRTYLDSVSAEMEGKADVGFSTFYLPRMVKDHKALLKAMKLEPQNEVWKFLKQTADKEGVAVEDLNAAQMGNLLNQYMKTKIPETMKAGLTSHMKERILTQVPKELQAYYVNPVEALQHYAVTMSANLEKRTLFGYNPSKLDATGVELRNSLGHMLALDVKDGNISSGDVDNLMSLLHARFSGGEKTMARGLQQAKNWMYSGVLANPISAVTQGGDVALAAYMNGMGNTLGGLFKTLTRTGTKRHELGLAKAGEELAGIPAQSKTLEALANVPGMKTIANWMSRMTNPIMSHVTLDNAMKYSGFQAMDTLGKETLMNGSITKYRKMASSLDGIEKLRKTFGTAFTPEEFNKLARDLRSGEMSQDIKYLAFHDLSKMQPISLSEMPQAYLNNPNLGRFAYALKSFTIKQLDRMYTDGIEAMRAGNYEKGAKALTNYTTLLIAGGMATDQIKAALLQREQNIDDTFVSNLFKAAATSDYAVSMAKKGDIGGAVNATIMPPIAPMGTALANDLIMTAQGERGLEEWRSFKYVPVIGRFWDNYFAGGLERYNSYANKEK